MEVILLKDVEKLGKEGEIVEIKDGYGRNYLIPRKLATLSNPQGLKILEVRKKRRILKEEKLKSEAKSISEKISSFSCTISVESGLDDKIFGTVTPEMIRNALIEERLDIDKKHILIEEQIKKLGVYQIKIKLHPEIIASLRIWVVKK